MIFVKVGLAAAGTASIFAAASVARSQVTLDVAEVTCEQFTRYKISNPENIAIWISGYYAGVHGDTVIDTLTVMANARKLQDYCFHNQERRVLEAVEEILHAK
jgi:hypothetical protein